MAEDGLLFKFLARINFQTLTPTLATVVSGTAAGITAYNDPPNCRIRLKSENFPFSHFRLPIQPARLGGPHGTGHSLRFRPRSRLHHRLAIPTRGEHGQRCE